MTGTRPRAKGYQHGDDVTFGDGVFDTLTVGGVVIDSDLVVDPAVSNPKALSQAIHLTAASSGSNGITVADDAKYDNDTNDFGGWLGFNVPDTTPASAITLQRKHDGTNGYILLLLTTGKLRLTINGTNYDSTMAISASGGQWTEIDWDVEREDASNAGAAVFTENGVQLGDSVAITAGTPTTVSNAVSYYAMGTSSTRTEGDIKTHGIYNRHRTVAEMESRYLNGVAYADKGGSQAEKVTDGGFDDSTKWNVGGTATVDDAGNSLATITANGTGNNYFINDGAAAAMSFSKGKMYRLKYVVDSNTLVGSGAVNIGTTSGSEPVSGNSLTDLTVGTHYLEFTATRDGTRLGLRDTAGYTSGSIAFSSISVVAIGNTLSLDPEGINSSLQWQDNSGNKLHAVLPPDGASLVRPKKEFEIRWTNTWAGTHEAQYIGGVNQNILPNNAYIESIVGTISGATIEDIIIGDGSDTDRFVAATTGLAAGTTSFTLANRTHDGTNKKLVVDPDANFTGSIAFVVRGYLLEG